MKIFIALLLILFVHTSNHAQIIDFEGGKYPSIKCTVNCTINRIIKHKNVFDIHAEIEGLKIRILSIKNGRFNYDKIRIKRSYLIDLVPFFNDGDTVYFFPDYIEYNEVSIKVFDNYSPYIYIGDNLKGLYYIPKTK